MPKRLPKIETYVEVGQKRVFAGAIEWPGWCRSGRDKDAAMESLIAYGPRYSAVLRGRRLGFTPPTDVSDLEVVERLKGDATTDFGAPGQSPERDKRPVDGPELKWMHTLLKASWAAFDRAVTAASGKELRKGPRGGGRDLDKIVQHVLDSDGAYLAGLGAKYRAADDGDPDGELRRIRKAVIDSLNSAAQGEFPATGPRGGARWTPRRYVRRAVWHVLDHAWEIEDRAVDR